MKEIFTFWFFNCRSRPFGNVQKFRMWNGWFIDSRNSYL